MQKQKKHFNPVLNAVVDFIYTKQQHKRKPQIHIHKITNECTISASNIHFLHYSCNFIIFWKWNFPLFRNTLLTEEVFIEVQDGQSYSAVWKINVYEVWDSMTPFLKHLYKLTWEYSEGLAFTDSWKSYRGFGKCLHWGNISYPPVACYSTQESIHMLLDLS